MEHSEALKDLALFFEDRCRLILVGKTGAGKSATGNTILGHEVFKVGNGENPETDSCNVSHCVQRGLAILVMDTPGLCGIEEKDDQITTIISQSFFGVAPGPHAIVLVLRCDSSLTDQNIKVFQMLKTAFGPNMTSHLIVIVAGRDQLEKRGADFENQLQKSDMLSGLLQEAGNRYLLFNNEADANEKEKQRMQLLRLVKEVVIQNGGCCFQQTISRQLSDTDKEVFPDGCCRLILIGKTGAGKSSTGNTILGQGEHFKSQIGINSETKCCSLSMAMQNGLEIRVLDSPGLCDTDGDDTEMHRMITQSLFAVAPGPHAVIFVLRCDSRFTEEEYKVFETLKHIFGSEMTAYMIVILTGKDQLEKKGVNFEEQLEKASRLKRLLQEASNRYMLFNNEGDDHEKATQREQLIDLVKTIVKENGGRCFRHKISHELDITMENMVKEEIRARTLFQEETPEEKEKAGGDDVRQAENQAVLRKKEVEDLKKRGKVKARLLQFSQSPSPEPAPEKPARLYSKGTPQGNLESKNAAFNQHQDQPLKKLTPTDGSPFVYEVPDNPGMTLAENKRLVKYALMSKVVSCPEELNDAQKEELNKAVKSVGTKFKEGMNKFSLKAINQCRLM